MWWKSSDKVLPPTLTRVIFYIPFADREFIGQLTSIFSPNLQWMGDGKGEYYSIMGTYWMELPDPPNHSTLTGNIME